MARLIALVFSMALLMTVQCFRVQKMPMRVRQRALLRMMDPSLIQVHTTTLLDSAASPLASDAISTGFEMESLTQLIQSLDFHKYTFMFPVAILVSSLAISAGIGGAALFAPILLIIFPLLGPEYPLQSSAASVATAILVETFGFSSGLYGYARRSLIDIKTALLFIAIAVPTAVLAASQLTLSPIVLKFCYTALMLGLSFFLLKGEGTEGGDVSIEREGIESDDDSDTQVLKLDSDGKEYTFSRVGLVSTTSVISTIVGASLTGVLGVGIGEVVLPQLLRKQYPVAIAAASSTMIVTFTALSSAVIQLSQLMSSEAGLEAIPINLVCFMIPGVLIGGQIASRLQGRIEQCVLQRAIGALFGVIGMAFAAVLYKQIMM